MPGDPVEALMGALRSLARARGAGIVGIARAAGQDRVKINVRALYKHHDEESGYLLIEDAIRAALEEAPGRLEEMGIRIVRLGRDLYVEVPVDLLDRLSRERE